MNSPLLRASALLLLAALPACASKTPALDRQFGAAVTAARQAQIIHPGAPASRSVAGIDGQAGKSAYDSYQKSYKTPEPQTGALSIAVGR